MPGQRRRRWPGIKQTPGQRLVSADDPSVILKLSAAEQMPAVGQSYCASHLQLCTQVTAVHTILVYAD